MEKKPMNNMCILYFDNCPATNLTICWYDKLITIINGSGHIIKEYQNHFYFWKMNRLMNKGAMFKSLSIVYDIDVCRSYYESILQKMK